MKALYAIVISALALTSCGGSNTSDQKADSIAADPTTQAVAQASNADPSTLEPGAVPVGIVDFKADAGLTPETKVDYPVIIDFNATWCGPCKRFTPSFKAAAEKYSGQAAFIEVDIDQNPQTAQAFGVSSIPQLSILMPDGTLKSYVGTADLIDENDPKSTTKFIDLLANYIK